MQENSPSCPNLELALTKPEDLELFYSASVHFLRRRLEEKVQMPHCNTSYQCDINRRQNKFPSLKQKKDVDIELPFELPLNEVLPFPKASKEGFLSKLKSLYTRWKPSKIREESDMEEENLEKVSRFKFSRVERLDNIIPESSENDLTEDSEREIS